MEKSGQNRHIRCDNKNVVVSVTGHSERELAKRFDNTDINLSIIEKQLLVLGRAFPIW
jgi:transcriptional regulator